MRILSFWFAAGAVMVINALADPSVSPSPEKWPVAWREAYERFEAYITARGNYWQRSELNIQPDGTLEQGVMIYPGRMQHLGLAIYQDGEERLGIAVKGVINVVKDRGIEPGDYVASLRSASSLGYQHHSPMCWFSVIDQPEVASGRMIRTVKMRPPPANEETFWPNERMQLFLDFHILPHGLPNDLQLKNSKVPQSVELRLDRDGGVRRIPLGDPAMESLLRWRVYHQGRLVDQSSAADQLLYTPVSGAGAYVVMLVIKGPRGEMPVSNVMEYPLFPEADGHFAIVPKDADGDRLPDFLDANPDIPAAGELYQRNTDDSLINATVDPQWVRLWRRWSYRITTEGEKFPENLGVVKTPAP